jgi:hypothetical protein
VNEPRLRGDDGASLILALTFLALLSIFIVPVLSLGAVSFENTTVTRSRADQLYAADGGIEHAIRKLQTQPSLCATAATFPTSAGTMTLNDKQVDVTCQTTEGGTTSVSGSPLLNGYVAVIGPGGITQTGDGWGVSQIHGSLYSGGTISPGAGVLGVARQISVIGDLELAQGPCPPTNVTATSCSVLPSQPTVPPPTVVIPPSTATAPPPRVVGDCTILYPGRYTNSNTPVFDEDNRYYLASGTYYFSGSNDVILKGRIFGGAQSSGAPWNDAPKVTGTTPCATDVTAQSRVGASVYNAAQAGTGVTIVRGGTGKFRIEHDASKVELYTRVPGTAPGSRDLGATPGVSFWASNAPRAGYTPVPANVDVFVTTARDAEVVLHGLSYLPDSYANLREPFNEETTTPGQVSFFLGGLAAKRLSVVRVFDWTFPPISLAGTGEDTVIQEPRTTTVTATAQSTSGGAPTTVIAVVEPDVTPPRIVTWRQS